MNDSIYRQAAIDVLEERLKANGYSNATLASELNRSIGYLMRLPSVEAEPVRHGKWLPDNNTFERMYHVCSFCKRATQIPRYVGGFLYDYCPNCGAKMDEVT